MMTYNRGQWIEDTSLPDEYGYSSDKGLNYAGYESYSNWNIGIDALQVKIHWATDERFDSAPYRYLAYIETPFFGDGVLIKDFPSLLMFLKEMTPLLHEARDQELYEMREEEHRWLAEERRATTGKRDCGHL
jgi:hypothetical protein